MNLSHILITGTYDNHFNTSEEGTDFQICQRSDATHVSVYLVDVEGNAEPVKDFPLGDDPARAYVDALMRASKLSVERENLRILDTYQKRAGQLKDLGAAQPNVHVYKVGEDGEVRKQVEQEPVAWLAKTLKGSLAGRLCLAWPHNKLNPELYEGPFPVFRHADPGEVEQLRRHLHAARVALEARARTFDGLRAQLAEAQTLLREMRDKKHTFMPNLWERIDAILSASAEPKPFRTPDCPECACVQDGDCLCIPSKPSASVETDVFCEGQWWLAELDGLVESGTHDQKRAVAVVRNMMGQLAKARAEQEPKT